MINVSENLKSVIGRRQFLVMSAGAAFLASCGGSTSNTSVSTTTQILGTESSTTGASNPLWIPPAMSGTTFDIDLAASTHQLFDGAKTKTISYNGNPMWGPTLIMKKGDKVTVNVTNNLDEVTTAHWHGIHLPAIMDGGPHQTISAGNTWPAMWEVKNNAATYWYHPHAHELTWKQLNQGAGGFIIVQDDEEQALDLPRSYGIYDIPLVLTSRKFTSGNEIDTTAIYGDYLLANGTMNAEFLAPKQHVRFRVLNAEIERAYTLGFSDGREFKVIATDGGLLDAPVTVTKLPIYPGERYEIVVDFSSDAEEKIVTMQSFNGGHPFLDYPGGEEAQTGAFGSLLNNKTFDLLKIKVTASTSSAVTKLPTVLAANTLWAKSDATKTRDIAITDTGPGTPFTFDNKGYEMDTIAHTVKLGDTEAWSVTNGQIFPHSFHIHDVQFSMVSRSTGPVADYEKGWKDTFSIVKGEKVTFVAKFEDYASNDHPFMYHCHMSNHEDEGLMGQFLVVE